MYWSIKSMLPAVFILIILCFRVNGQYGSYRGGRSAYGGYQDSYSRSMNYKTPQNYITSNQVQGVDFSDIDEDFLRSLGSIGSGGGKIKNTQSRRYEGYSDQNRHGSGYSWSNGEPPKFSVSHNYVLYEEPPPPLTVQPRLFTYNSGTWKNRPNSYSYSSSNSFYSQPPPRKEDHPPSSRWSKPSTATLSHTTYFNPSIESYEPPAEYYNSPTLDYEFPTPSQGSSQNNNPPNIWATMQTQPPPSPPSKTSRMPLGRMGYWSRPIGESTFPSQLPPPSTPPPSPKTPPPQTLPPPATEQPPPLLQSPPPPQPLVRLGSWKRPAVAPSPDEPPKPQPASGATPYFVMAPDNKLVPAKPSTMSGEVTSADLQGFSVGAGDDPFKAGSGWKVQGKPATSTVASRKLGPVTSNQLQGVQFSGSNDDLFQPENSNQGAQPPKAPRKRVEEQKLLTFEEIEKKIMTTEEYEEKYGPTQDVKRIGTFSTDPLGKEHLSTYEGVTKHVKMDARKVSAYKQLFNDPLWSHQWYLQDYRDKEMPVMDLNVVPVWEMGITGQGVYVAVVDDGVLHDHPDLAPNHDTEKSIDYNQGIRGSSQPDAPRMSLVEGRVPDTMTHGSKCAGEIAMVPNNEICGVGVAHGSKIIGVKVKGGDIIGNRLRSERDPGTEYEEGKGLVYNMDIVDVSSNSYGSIDDGKFPQFISPIRKKYLEMGVMKGRGGLGTIYIFAAGNGRHDHDMCGADGTVNHLGVVAISAANFQGKTTLLGERCSAVFAVTYAEGKTEDATSIDRNGQCTNKFGSTSAAAPLASGIIALVMEAANRKGRKLSYRDVMHIISMGSEVAPLADNHNERSSEESTWTKNGAGFWVSLDFGFGLLNAKNMVKLAEKWQSVPEMVSCVVLVPMPGTPAAEVDKPVTEQFEVRNCKVKWLEAAFLMVDLEGEYRGAFEVALTSPAGTKTFLMESRENDHNSDMNNWAFKSIHTWGENPEGIWKIEVFSRKIFGKPDRSALVHDFKFSAFGLAGPPPHRAMLPRSYSAFRLIDGRTSHDS